LGDTPRLTRDTFEGVPDVEVAVLGINVGPTQREGFAHA